MHSAVLASPCNIDCDNDRDCDVGTPSLSPGPQPHENRDRRGWELRYGETFPAPCGLDNDNGGCVVGRPLLPASAASTVIRCTPPSLAAPRSLDDDHEDWNRGHSAIVVGPATSTAMATDPAIWGYLLPSPALATSMKTMGPAVGQSDDDGAKGRAFSCWAQEAQTCK
jgi:hypothetical protein